MTPAIESRWERLRRETEAARDAPHRFDKSAIARELQRLADKGCCAQEAKAWIKETRIQKGGIVVTFSTASDAVDNRGHQAVQLRGLSFLRDACSMPGCPPHLSHGPVLSLRIELDKNARVQTYGIGVEGITHSATLQRWYSRVDLTAVPEGEGLCGHALLHAHVGTDPEGAFSPRVPLPWVMPHEALQWLLATVHPPMEP